jgi:hypothetical protein
MLPRRSMARRDEEKFSFKPQNPKNFGTSAMALSQSGFDPQPVWLSGASNTVLTNSILEGAMANTPSTDLQYFTTQPTSFAGSIARDVAPYEMERKFRDRVFKESAVKPSDRTEKQKEYSSFKLDLGKSAWRKGIKNQLSVIAAQKQTSQDEVKKFIERDFKFSLLDGLTQGIREGFGLPRPTKYTQEQCDKLYTRVLALDPTLLTASWDTIYQILECLSVFQLFQKRYKETMRDITLFVKAELTKRGRAVGAAVGSAVTSFLANTANRNLMGDMREAFDWFRAMAQRLIDACNIFDLPKPEFDLELRMGQADDDDETILTSPTQPPAPPPPPGSSGTGLRNVPGANAQTSDSNLGMGGTGGGTPGGGAPPPGGQPPPPGTGSPPGQPSPTETTGSPPTIPDTSAIDNGVVKSSYTSFLIFAINSFLVPLSIFNMMRGIMTAVAVPSIPRDIEEASEQAVVLSRGHLQSIPTILSNLAPTRFWTSNLVIRVLLAYPSADWQGVSNIISRWCQFLVNQEVVNHGAGLPLLSSAESSEMLAVTETQNAEFILANFLRQDMPPEIRASIQRTLDELVRNRRQVPPEIRSSFQSTLEELNRRGEGGSTVAESSTQGSTRAESSTQAAERANRDETRVQVTSEVPQLIQQVQGLIGNFPTGLGVIQRRDPGIALANAFARMSNANGNGFMASGGVNLLDLARQVYRMTRFLLNNFYVGDSARARANRGLYMMPDTLDDPITSDTVLYYSRVAESLNIIDMSRSSPAVAGFRVFLLALVQMMEDYLRNQAEAAASATMVRP